MSTRNAFSQPALLKPCQAIKELRKEKHEKDKKPSFLGGGRDTVAPVNWCAFKHFFSLPFSLQATFMGVKN